MDNHDQVRKLLKEKRSQLTTLPSRLREILIQGRKDPVLFAEELLGMKLHPGQKKYLRNATKKINILTPSNRWGKSAIIAILQTWYNFYKFGIATGNQAAWQKAQYRTANIAPHSAMTEPVFKYIDQILTSSFPILQPDGTLETNKCQIEWFYIKESTLNTPPYKQFFANNSYIEHRSLGEDKGGSLQGKPYGLITYDEGGRSHHLEAEVRSNILPRLFDWNGPLHIPSTPDQNSPSILYHYELYEDGLNGLNNTYTQEGSLRDNNFFPPEQIQQQYDLYAGDPLREQVLEGKFVFGGGAIFNARSILNAKDPNLNDGLRHREGHKYVFGIDTAMGEDEFVVSVLDITNLKVTRGQDSIGRSKTHFEGYAELVRQVAAKGNSKSPQKHLNDFMDLFDSYKDGANINILLETWNGESARFYQDMPSHLKSITRCYGSWQPDKKQTENKNPVKSKTQVIKKADIIQSLNKMLSAGALKIPEEPDLIKQLSIYKEKDDRIPTDRTISLALAAYLASDGANSVSTPIFVKL